MKKPKSSVQEFADSIKDNPNAIIKWARREIAEYQKLIKILENNTTPALKQRRVGGDY